MSLGDCSLLESLVKIDLQDKEKRNSDTRQNDSDPAETPSPVLDIEDKSSGSLGTGKSRNHVWRGSKGKGQTSVPEIRCIRSEDTNGINHTSPSDRVEDLRSTEGGEVLRYSHEDKTKSCKATHEQEALSASPDVEGLGHGDVAGCSHGVGHDGDGGHEGMGLPLAGNIRHQDEVEGTTESTYEEECPDAVEVWLEIYRESVSGVQLTDTREQPGIPYPK